ncbi:MAG: hypothetical protein A4S14_05790 [Proteobacteria bacterium SG_bin9]|nr:MAG: hypothetical protein A4S14_05790 [Proteobacteria bacterium SG_bin9]
MYASTEIKSGFVELVRHTTHYLEAGPANGTPIIFVHGWPELSLAWRHQLKAFADRGYRVIAPDLRGCGSSRLHLNLAAYTQREIVLDMIELVDQLNIERAIWVGHDWGSAVVWNVANHHPERCFAVASLCVPYWTLERGIGEASALLNRDQYPEDVFPAGQFEYMLFYQEQFDVATEVFGRNHEATFKVIMRRGDPGLAGTQFLTAFVRKRGGWFGPGKSPPDVPLDQKILSTEDLRAYAESYRRTGFFGINALYMNDDKNKRYSDEALDKGVLRLPVLFLSGRYDYVSDTERSNLTLPMQDRCTRLRMRTLDTGHWMQHEAPEEVNKELMAWISQDVFPVRITINRTA